MLVLHCRSRPQPSAAATELPTSSGQQATSLNEGAKWYNISIAAVQETKWFRSDIWKAKRHVFLHSVRGIGSFLREKVDESW